MKSSMADYLKVVTPYLHSDLISPEAMSRLQALANILPWFSKGMLEFRLSANQSQVDLSVFLACRTPELPEKFLIHPAWQAFFNFCQQWSDRTSSLYRDLQYAGLEFDLEDRLCEVPIPSFFVSWNQEIVSDLQVLKEIAPKIPNYPVSLKLETNLQRCVDSLPIGARIESIGVMLSRPAQVVRVIMNGIPLQQVSDYLMKIGWSDPTDKLSTLISTLFNFAPEIRLLALDVGDIIYPRIGLEFFIKKQSQQEPRWQLFLDHLVEMGLCTPAKKNALLAWPGVSRKVDMPKLWPQNLTGGDLLLGANSCSAFVRTLNHIKIVYIPGRPLEAKGYLWFCHDWWT